MNFCVHAKMIFDAVTGERLRRRSVSADLAIFQPNNAIRKLRRKGKIVQHNN